jgi:hypothetical protein
MGILELLYSLLIDSLQEHSIVPLQPITGFWNGYSAKASRSIVTGDVEP